jgi:serine/threonine protein kinase
MSCPTDQELQGFHRGKLPVPLLEEVGTHLSTCDRCQASLTLLDDSSDPFIAGFRKKSKTSLTPPPTRIGNYQVLRELGRGGMGVVYLVEHVELKKKFALKLILPHRLVNPEAIDRFRREIKSQGKIAHPNVVTATDAGQHEHSPWLVLEYLSGQNLGQVIRRGRLSVADACEIAMQVAIGLSHIHACNLVHRDIKPSNIMLTEDGTAKILDLGLARYAAEPAFTLSDQILGTIDYLPPEQIRSPGEVGREADLYSLGCTLYRMLTGEVPFPSDVYANAPAKLLAHCETSPQSVREQRDDVPVELAEIVDSLLHKDPQKRLDAEELVAALKPFTTGNQLTESLHIQEVEIHPVADFKQNQALTKNKRVKLRRAAAMLSVAGLLVILGLGATILPSYFAGSTFEATESLEWQFLLQKPPRQLFWPGGEHSGWEFQDESVFYHSPDVGVLVMGQTHAKNYELQVGFHQNRWHGGTGVAFGIHDELRDGKTIQKFQYVSIAPAMPGGGNAFSIERGAIETWIEKGQRRIRNQLLVGVDFPKLKGEQLLEVSVVDGKLNGFYLSGRPLPELTKSGIGSDIPVVGEIGVILSLSSGKVSKARLKETTSER